MTKRYKGRLCTTWDLMLRCKAHIQSKMCTVICAPEVEHTPPRKWKLYQHKLESPLQWTIARAMSTHPQQPCSMAILSTHPQQPLKIGRLQQLSWIWIIVIHSCLLRTDIPNVLSRYLQQLYNLLWLPIAANLVGGYLFCAFTPLLLGLVSIQLILSCYNYI